MLDSAGELDSVTLTLYVCLVR